MVWFPYGESALLHRRAGQTRNAHGAVVPEYAAPVELQKVAFAPGSSSEPQDGASQRVVTQPTLYITDGTVVGPLDQVTVRGVRYEVDGDMSGQWVNPFTGHSPGSAVTLRKVSG